MPAADELIVQKRYVNVAWCAALVGSSAAEHRRRRLEDWKPDSGPIIGPHEVEKSQWFEVLSHEALAIVGNSRGNWSSWLGVSIFQHIVANPKSRPIAKNNRSSNLQIDAIERLERLNLDPSHGIFETHVPLGHGFHTLVQHLVAAAESRTFVHPDELEQWNPVIRMLNSSIS